MTVFPVERVRSQFPALSTPSVFLDNPAGTQVPRQVIEAVSGAMVLAASNTGGYFQASNYASNLTGSINPAAELIKLAKGAGALVYVDAVQFVPHGPADVAKLDCDFLACSS